VIPDIPKLFIRNENAISRAAARKIGFYVGYQRALGVILELF